MQSGKLCIHNSLVRQLGNFTPHLGTAMYVSFTKPYLYIILSIIIGVRISFYFAPNDSNQLDTIYLICMDNSFLIIYLTSSASSNKASVNACTR